MTSYPPTFYEELKRGVRHSAEVIVPIVMQLLRPRGVVDVGCGLGTWLSVFADSGVERILGVDGSHVDRESLEIPADSFLPFDLTTPLKLDEDFDLVVSLEVGEHLPSECAAAFVNSLTGLGRAILFSAAIPFQEGRHHVNEQWPQYWTEHFQRNGYAAVDCLRPKIWTDDRVQWWYRQNILLFIQQSDLRDYEDLITTTEEHRRQPLSLVHPVRYLEVVEKYQSSQSELWRLKSQLIAQDLHRSIPAGETLILVDQDQLDRRVTASYTVIPFLEREGDYAGVPPDDGTAVAEVARLQRSGARFMVFAWPAFWWLEHYTQLTRHLRSNFRCLVENNRLVAFDLRDKAVDCDGEGR